MKRIDHLSKLATLDAVPAPVRVVYPSSGSNFFGVKVDGSMVVEHKCYYINLETEDEVNYLMSVLSAQCLQRAYVDSKVSSYDFDTYPLRSIPIPKFDPQDQRHAELSRLGANAEQVATSVPVAGGQVMMRRIIRDALTEDGVSDEIDRYVRELLPDYASSE